jgi:hypothetical protein
MCRRRRGDAGPTGRSIVLSDEERFLRFHIARGVHSRIPACCIAYWLAVHSRRNHGRPTRVRKDRVASLPGYVRCPKCVRSGHKVQIHRCTRRCAGQLGASDGAEVAPPYEYGARRPVLALPRRRQ